MPIYEYHCASCDADFELLIRTPRAERDVRCPECGRTRVERRVSVFTPRRGRESMPLPTGGCGRCGDPNGPCGLE